MLLQLSEFVIIIVALWLAESISTLDKATGKWRRARINSLFVLTALPIQFVMSTLCFGAAKWVTGANWGLVHFLKNSEAPSIKYGFMFFALDFLDYVYHRAMHHLPILWRFHLMHHTDLAVDVSTTVREHPGETFIRNCFLMFWVFLMGASIQILIIRQLAETAVNIFSHTSFRLPRRLAQIVGWLFVTPNLHHAHHHYKMPATNRNFGDVFSIWDRLFGTLAALPREELVFGLDTHIDGHLDNRLMEYGSRVGLFAGRRKREIIADSIELERGNARVFRFD